MKHLITIIKYILFPLGFYLFVRQYTNICFRSSDYSRFEDLPGITLLIIVTISLIIIFENIFPYNKYWNKYNKYDLNDVLFFFSSQLNDSISRVIIYAITPIFFQNINTYLNIWPNESPIYLQIILGLLIYDFTYYLYHRMFHKFNSLWRIHRIHHTSTKLTFTKTFRFNIIELFFENIIIFSVLKIAGIPIEILIWVLAFISYTVLVKHANIDIKVPKFLDWIFVLPTNHRIHHSVNEEYYNSNFSGFTMIWDVIFKTYKNGSIYKPDKLGVDGYKLSNNFIKQYFDFLNP